MITPPVAIVAFSSLASNAAALAAIDDVFYSSSNTQSFPDAPARLAFRERWLGRYLENVPECCFVAVDAAGRAVGYVCGSLRDPARDPLFADLPHFAPFAHLTPRFPAQLHVNLDAGSRGQGIGGRLVDAFLVKACAEGAAGVHAITSRGARNVGFYNTNGFAEVGSAEIGGNVLVFLGRNLR